MSDVQFHSTYNLPWGYQENRVTLMARDPYLLYAYWEISPTRRNSFIEQFGQTLWDRSTPVLKVTDVTHNSTLYIRISEEATNWYIEVPNADTIYTAELGRQVSEEFFIHLATSNYVSTPGDKLSSDHLTYFIDYKDLKNGTLDLAARCIRETHTTEYHSQFLLGLSSPELAGLHLEQTYSGISSTELLGRSISQHFGISSEILFR